MCSSLRLCSSYHMQQPAGQSGAGYTTCNLVVPTIGLSSRLLWEKRKEEKKERVSALLLLLLLAVELVGGEIYKCLPYIVSEAA